MATCRRDVIFALRRADNLCREVAMPLRHFASDASTASLYLDESRFHTKKNLFFKEVCHDYE
jgi:hypothetical protein